MNVDTGTSADLAIVRAEPTLSGIDRVLVADRLSELFGFPTRVTRLRYKPGTSLVAAWRRTDVDAPRIADVGWIGVFADQVKLDKTRRNAARCGARVEGFAGFPGMLAGDLWSDRPLGATLHRLRSGYAPLLADATVMRHNPLRRVVWHSRTATGALAIKVTTHTPHASVSVSRSLAAAGHPVIPIDEIPGCPGATTSTWWGTGTLAARPTTAGACAAGDALARMHRHETHRAGKSTGPAHLDPALRAGVEAVTAVLPDLTDRARAVAADIAAALTHLPPTGVTARVHGDFSADQVLVDGSGIRIIDFDRTTVGPVERDPGTFAAAALLGGHPQLTDHLLRGYRAAGGHIDPDRLRAWTAWGLFCRVIEPFRAHEPGWPEQIDETLTLAIDVLDGRR